MSTVTKTPASFFMELTWRLYKVAVKEATEIAKKTGGIT
jgi:hypothetical protein